MHTDCIRDLANALLEDCLALKILLKIPAWLCHDQVPYKAKNCSAGILLWSIALIQEGQDVAAALCFAVLLNMKHLFAVLAPLYFVYLLRHYCRCEQRRNSMFTHFLNHTKAPSDACCVHDELITSALPCLPAIATYSGAYGSRWRSEGCCMMEPQADSSVRPLAEADKLASQLAGAWCRGPAALHRFLTLGAVTAAVFAISFGPFIAAGQMHQVALTQVSHGKLCVKHRSLQEPFLGVPCTSCPKCSMYTSRRCNVTAHEMSVL